MTIRPGNAGDDGNSKAHQERRRRRARLSNFTIVEGRIAKRKLWAFMITSGTTDGHEQAGDITRRRLRAIPRKRPRHQAD